MNRPTIKDLVVFVLLVTTGVTARVALQHVPNFAPVAGLALFAGYFFAQRWLAVGVPLAVMAISDRLVEAGGYDWRLMCVVYGLLVLPVLLRGPLRSFLSMGKVTPWRALAAGGGLVTCSLACSLLFFLGTNSMVWMTSSWYPSTWVGLVECIGNGLPFFRYTLAGDLSFALIFFGAYAAVKAAQPQAMESLAPNANY